MMVGVLVSSKTLRGETNDWPRRYPKVGYLGNIFTDHPQTLNLLHFNTRKTGHIDEVLAELKFAQNKAGPHCHGFQLNMPWPKPSLLEQYKATQFKCKTVVLQCGGKALEAVGMSGSALATKLQEYRGLIDYALVDPSGGVGQEFDLALAEECFAYLEDLDWLVYGIAGGLEVGNLSRLNTLLQRHPDFSIDAEGRLRIKDSDELDIPAAIDYLLTANYLFERGVLA